MQHAIQPCNAEFVDFSDQAQIDTLLRAPCLPHRPRQISPTCEGAPIFQPAGKDHLDLILFGLPEVVRIIFSASLASVLHWH
jgi:hypothetical protein